MREIIASLCGVAGPGARHPRDPGRESLPAEAPGGAPGPRAGLPEDYLSEKPRCALCGDTGYRGDGLCACLRSYYAREQIAELSHMLDIGSQSFDTFRAGLLFHGSGQPAPLPPGKRPSGT